MKALRTALILAAAIGAFAFPLLADDEIALRKYHPWGRFHVGSWSRVRILTETLDARGNVTATSTTDTKSTLIERGIESFALKIESTVEVAGKKLPPQAQSVRLGYAGESLGEQLSYRNLESGRLSVEGREIPCDVQEVEIIGSGQKRVSLVTYADDVAPFVLHRKTTQTDASNPKLALETELEVIALDMPFKVAGKLQNTAHTRQVQRGQRGANVTLSVISEEVPGELVSQTAKKTDERGVATFRSSLELIGYYVAPEPFDESHESNDVRLPRRYHKRSRR
jgi:hypothetical protein